MLKKNIIKILTFSLLLGICLISGCSPNTYRATTARFIEPAPPSITETSIYLFREKHSWAAGRKLAIICNDTVVGVLTPGRFCQFTVPSGENEIVGYMGGPKMHYRIQDQPGKKVYLYCRKGPDGPFMEKIDTVAAKKLMGRYKFMKIGVKGRKTRHNYKEYYDNIQK